jgi:DNA-binding GntR family transcriptional regulator
MLLTIVMLLGDEYPVLTTKCSRNIMNGAMNDENDVISATRLKEVTNELKRTIASGERKPGQRLVEAQLCESFGVKRSLIREALRKLAHEGFVKITSNVGASVVEFSRDDIEQVYDLLSVLEGLAVRLATPFVTESQLLEIEELLKLMEGTDTQPAFSQYNDELHVLLCALSGNKRLIALTDNLRLSKSAFGYQSLFVPRQTAISNDEHRKILQAIKDNEPVEAERLMRNHLVNAKNLLIKWLYRSL